MMSTLDLTRKDNSMFFFHKKKLEYDEKKAEADAIVSETVGKIDKTTEAVRKLNKTLSKVSTYDMAEKLYYATRRAK